MDVKFRVTRRGVASVIAVVTLVAAAGVAYATIPGSDGVISACRDAKTGVLRAIDAEAGEACEAKEVPLNWNQTGPQGPQGDPGPPGPAGTAAAFARVNDNGTVNADFAQGISSANVSNPAPGIYCLRNLGFQPRAVVATGPAGIRPDGSGGFLASGYDTNVTANIRLASSDTFLVFCDTETTPPADRAVVRIYVYQSGAYETPAGLVNRSFTVLLED